MVRQYAAAGTVCLVCLATVLAHIGIVRRAERRVERLVSRATDVVPVLEPIEGDHTPFFGQDPPSPDEVLAQLPDETPARRPRLLEMLTQAEGKLDRPVDSLRAAAEEVLEPLPSERSLNKRQREDQAAVRAVIEEEMPEAGTEERDIWFEELKSLPAEVVRDLLQVRQQLRVLSPDLHLSGPAQLHPHHAAAAPIADRSIPAEPVKQSRPVPQQHWSETRQSLEEAITWTTHNLANAATPGFKRSEILLGDAYRMDDAHGLSAAEAPLIGDGCRLAVVQLDMSPGELQETKRPFDLAIDGPGLFVLRVNSAEQDLYTRNGRFTVDLQRRLGIVRDDEICLLQPVLTLPEETVSVKIGADGVVTATFVDQVEEQTVGQLKLAIFVDQSHLAPMGSSLLIAPPEIVPRLVNPGSNSAGVIRQGYLEQSNVDVNRELADREQWESILRSLPTTDLPRTARDATRSQN